MTRTRLALTSAFASVIAAALLVGLTAIASAKPVKIGAETNLRKTPGTKSEVVLLIPKGETVEVGNCDAGWCEVAWNGQNGYVIARNLGVASRAAPAQRRVVRRSVDEDDEIVEGGPPVVYEGGPYVAGPPVYYGYYPYPYWYGGRGWYGGGYHHRRW